MITELRKKMVDVVLECLVKKATFITTPIGNKYKTKFILMVKKMLKNF